MIIKTTNGVEIDTESRIYREFLQDLEDDKLYGEYPEPSGWRTLGEAIEMDRLQHEREAREAANANAPATREKVAA